MENNDNITLWSEPPTDLGLNDEEINRMEGMSTTNRQIPMNSEIFILKNSQLPMIATNETVV